MIICGIALVISGVVWISRRTSMSAEKKRMLGIIVAAALLGGLEGVAQSRSPILLEGNLLARNENGEGSYEQDLRLHVEGEDEAFEYHIEVPEQILTEAEEQQYLAAAREEIAQEFPGENESVNCIRGRVTIRESYQNGKVEAEWYFDNYKIMDSGGNVVAKDLPSEGELVKARMELGCGTSDLAEEFYFRVFPPVLDEKGTFLRLLEKTLLEQGEAAGQKFITLPGAVGAYRLAWQEKSNGMPQQILLFGGILAAFIPMLERSRKREEEKKRSCLLELEYSDMVSKLALLLGAGMTLQGAFRKIAYAYEENRKNHAVQEMPAYEEMLVTCREMESGVGEQRAYERFGERCKLPMYRRIGSILAQNLRKGSQSVVLLLEQEVWNAFEERKSAAKKYGEEAGTKLLFPMMIMLGIVMIILIIPAVFAFEIS